MVNANDSEFDEEGMHFSAPVNEKGIAAKSRASHENVVNFTDLSGGTFTNTELDEKNNVGLTWELPRHPYEMDSNTQLLSHFENSLVGVDDEVPTSYTRSTYLAQGIWNFDEGTGTTAYDSSGLGRHGTISGATWTTDSRHGTALNFDGVDDYMTTAFYPVEYSPHTMEAWIKLSEISGDQMLFGSMDSGTVRGMWFEIVGDDLNTYYLINGISTSLRSYLSLQIGQWYYVVSVYDGSDIIHYLDGVRQESRTASIAIVSEGGPLYIGSSGTWATTSYTFPGAVHSAGFYSRAKSGEEIKSDYEEYLANYVSYASGRYSKGLKIDEDTTVGYPVGMVPEDNCVGFWRFNDGSGTTARDISGQGNDGTLKNGPQWVTGKEGRAIQFDGTDDNVDCGRSASLDITGYNITYEAWVYHQFTPGAHTYGNILRKFWSGGSWLRFELNSEWISFNLKGVGGCKGSTTLQPDTWYHIAGTYDGARMKIYLNGKLDGIATYSNPIESSAAISLIIGAGDASGAEPWKGKIDEFAVYNRSKSADEIYYDYLAGAQQNFDRKRGTLELWVRPNWDGNDGINHTIFFSGYSSDNDSFFIYKSETNKLVFKTSNNRSKSQNNPSVSVSNWESNTWYHLAFTWDSGTKQIYIDGQLQASEVNNKMPDKTYPKVYIGTNPDHNLYGINGTIDELRISNVVRPPADFRVYHPWGIYESAVFDATEPVQWQNIAWSAIHNVGAVLFVQSRTSEDNTIWTNWTGNIYGTYGELLYMDSTGESINAENSQYIQWRAVFNSVDGVFTPILEKANITWNYLPRVYNVTITPMKPTVRDNLVVNYSYEDADNDMEGDTKFEWYVDRGTGFIRSGFRNQILPETETEPGENWYCTIIPHDGKGYGFAVNTETVTILAGPLARIEVMPNSITITTDEEAKFSAEAFDSEDNQITTTFTWNTTGDGAIDQTGNFVPSRWSVQGVSASAGGIVGYAVVKVLPGSIDKVEVHPSNPVISTDDMILFEGVAFDAKNNFIPDLDMNWSVSGGGNIGEKTGLFEAEEPGTWTVTVNISGVFANTLLTIKPGRVHNFQVVTNNTTIAADSELQLAVQGFDEDGNLVPANFNWEVENGEITQDGLFIPTEVGRWNITVMGKDSDVSIKIPVTVLRGKPDKLALEPDVHLMKVNETKRFTTTAYDIKGNFWLVNTGIDWSVTNPSLGYFDSSGIFHAVKAGKTTVVASITIENNGGNGNGGGNGSNSTRTEATVTGSAEITIYEEPQPVQPPVGGGTEKEAGAESTNLVLLILIIIMIIIILILIFLILRKRKVEEPREKERPAEEEEEEEMEEEAEREGEEEAVGEEEEEWETVEEEGLEEARIPEEEEEPSVGWEVLEEEEEEELDEEYAPPEVKQVPAKGKLPKAGKMPKEGKMPVKEEEEFEFDEELSEILKPTPSGVRPSGKPQLMRAEKSVKCNICLGFIKTGLMEIHCTCGKHYHEQCANRVGFCPVCDTDLTNPEDVIEEEGD